MNLFNLLKQEFIFFISMAAKSTPTKRCSLLGKPAAAPEVPNSNPGYNMNIKLPVLGATNG